MVIKSSCEEVVCLTWASRSGVGNEGDILCKVEKCGKKMFLGMLGWS